MKPNNKTPFIPSISAWILSIGLVTYPTLTLANQNELTGVKSEITRQQKELSAQQKELDKLQKSLRQQEVGISNIEKEIKSTTAQLAQANRNLDSFHQQVEELTEQKKQQQKILAELVQTYYVTKQNNSASSVFSTNPDEDRISQYYQYLAKARAETLEKLAQTELDLAESERALELERNQIAQLLEQQKDKRNSLAKNQASRKSTVSKIRKSISSDKTYLAELQRNETRLKAEIAKAAKRNQVPMDGLARQKGKLPWPVKGKVLHSFGTKQTGQVNWKGMVIQANYGESIKSVYSGTVVFADYLRGYGLVVLLDHGKGDMTLYGYNQTLLKKEGDKVSAGETIALAGDTGGQSSSSLYFEIRRNSKVQNPKSWLKR
ncbi:murein hydrolase activator EnvC family protein [Vibrio mediterranei]|uniref:Peptidase M23 n=1 Tax=Vibrio mediterranei TaxID=689 RepID=A0AAN1FFH2_9VIBR|nr:murein hydrolase activator EnvC [Vibrio mediterranei]ASI89661.1 peptidase M23 [Vibrio mediterranei]MCG9656343.1 murein hydrolase activator EnvC [Vibrio mediterranei]MCG9665488.1 murein hydrolase activator EnvC [Vibrio mediterranei]PTC02714.1 peptidase M23 [Vibrio mediterranei]SBO12544.1 Murein hydrolase activator EnvC precursor [Vibrio mediterranei]